MIWWTMHPLGDAPSTVAVSVAVASTAGALTLRLSLGRRADLALAWGFIVAAIFGTITMRVADLATPDAPYTGDGLRMFSWFLGGVASLYVAMPFLQILAETGRPHFPYATLFERTWANAYTIAAALLFTGALWSLLGIWAELFDLIGITVFSRLFSSNPFAYITTFTALGVGLALGSASRRQVAPPTHITRLITQMLLPVACFVALIFLAALPVTGLLPLWRTGSATPLVLTLLLLLAVSLNALYEDGRRESPPSWMQRLARAGVVAMPFYIAIGVHATMLRVRQHGLTPERVYALALLAIAGMFSFGYALAALRRRQHWMPGIETANVAGAAFLIAATLALATPPLDPFRLSADDQYRRFVSGASSARDFDFAALRFDLGRYGWETLRKIEDLRDHPESEAIRERIAKVRSAESRRGLEKGREVDPAGFVLSPPNLSISSALLQQIEKELQIHGATCTIAAPCSLLEADLDTDGRREVCFVATSVAGALHTRCYTESSPDEWTSMGRLGVRGQRVSAAEVGERLRASSPQLRDSTFREIDLGDGTALFVAPDP